MTYSASTDPELADWLRWQVPGWSLDGDRRAS